MKKIFVLVLCAVMVLTVFSGCDAAEDSRETTGSPAVQHTLSVGFGKADVTPEGPVPMNGLENALSRMSKEVIDPLYATCVAFTDETGNTVIQFALEALHAYDVHRFIAKDIEDATGVPYANIMIGTNHSHSSPSIPNVDEPSIEAYTEMLREKMVEAAQQALADRKPATMYVTTAYPENINFIRHYVMNDGTYSGDAFGKFIGAKEPRHVREVDNALQLVKFTREGSKDILMMNWQGHPTGHYDHYYSIMSFSGRVVSAVEEALDCHCIYILGASGNVNNGTKIQEEKIYNTYEEKAAALANYAIEANDYQKVETGKVQIMGKSCECTPKNEANYKLNISLNAFSIGDVALVTAPYEMYCENGEAVKDKSPFKMTLVSTCTNGAVSYIPSISTYAYNNKPDEVYGIYMTAYAPGTAELLEDTFVSMLNELYKTK